MSSPDLTPEQRRAETLAKLFDLRMFIGSLFVIYGVIVTLVMGIVLVRSRTSERVPVDRPKPSPAPSGSLAYAKDGDIFVAEWDGSNAVKVADGRSVEDCGGGLGEYWTEGATLWSPDGRYLAYRHDRCSNPEYSRDVVISDAQGNATIADWTLGTEARRLRRAGLALRSCDGGGRGGDGDGG